MSAEPSATRRGFLRTAMGAAGATAASGVGAAQESETVTVELVDFAFEPGTDQPLEIPPGTTVEFVWVTSTHNIVVESQPDGAEWNGHETVEDEGFETDHTFEVEGEYEIFCQPHRDLGMTGTITVTEDADLGGGDGGAPAGPVIPESAKTIGVATFVAMVATLGLAFALMKYGGEFKPE